MEVIINKDKELEEEIDRFEDWLNSYNQSDYPTSYTIRDIARHFAEWQKNKNAVPSCKKLYDAIKEGQEKKSFHDDFEKASYAQGMIDGSLWQKQQMKETLQTEYEKGRFDMREELMKDAVDAIFIQDYAYKTPVLYGDLKYKMNIVSGQPIELYQIKKEQQ